MNYSLKRYEVILDWIHKKLWRMYSENGSKKHPKLKYVFYIKWNK